MRVDIYVTTIMIARCDQCPAVYQLFSHSRFPSSYTFVSSGNIPLSLSRHQHDVYATFTRTLPSIFPIFLSPWPSPSIPWWFLASALTFISFCASSTLSRQLRSRPRRRHQQTSWLYRESHLDYESWLEAGRLAHRSCREAVPFFTLPYRTLLLTSPSSFILSFALPFLALARFCRPHLRNCGEHTNTGSCLVVVW